MRSPRTAKKSSPRSPQLEKARAQQWRPNAAKNKIIFKKEFYLKKKNRELFWFVSLPKQNVRQGIQVQVFYSGTGKRRQALKDVSSSKLPLRAIGASRHTGGKPGSLWGTPLRSTPPRRGSKGIYTPTPISHWLREAEGHLHWQFRPAGHMGRPTLAARKALSERDVSWHWMQLTYNTMTW